MPKYRVSLNESHWLTYEIETDLTEIHEVEDYFYSLSGSEQDKCKVSKKCYHWEIDEIEEMETDDATR